MIRKLALVAHDNQKDTLVSWALNHKGRLVALDLFATGTTGMRLQNEVGLNVHRFKSGALGGDQQLGAAIAEEKLDALIFFWDPMSPQPHDPDVKALLRLAVLYNIPTAMNESTADFLIAAPQFSGEYKRTLFTSS